MSRKILDTQISLKELVEWQLHWLCVEVEYNILGKDLPLDTFVDAIDRIVGTRSRIVNELNTIYDHPPNLDSELRVLPKWEALEALIQAAKARRFDQELRVAEDKLKTRLGIRS